ncbi:hypothetical protein [Polyangium spumosum]|uniref:Uncharacterized protein n=1 Tax=Polyangium spumosum TaxID=889282 RepID=A0A6N7PZ64_9BACT|nr:hypothetical protein [Polyangium spumosum]MRG97283.1 hypothetical protein [Polyangium spumosum]
MASCLAVALVASTAVASADVVADGPTRREIREQRKELREERKELREEKKELREDRKAGADKEELRDDKKEIREEKKELREARKELRADLKAKREEKRKELRAKWGETLKRPEARAELQVHARRMARLAQARKVAEADGKKELVARIDKLVEKEKARHQRVMDRLKDKKDPGGAP